VTCWGDNQYGQLGDGTTTARLTPVDVTGLTSGVAAISAGLDETGAVTTGGGAKCWGDNGYSQVGDGTTTNRLTPVDVSGLTSGVATIVSGAFRSCAVTTAGLRRLCGSLSSRSRRRVWRSRWR
jgi:alpha-tubulin suppressor-like RCC1 family protein